MQTDLIGQGLELMLFGMGTVVVFLMLLVLATSTMSALVRRIAPTPAQPAEPEGKPPAAGDPRLLAVITAAIRKHRTRNHP